MVNKFGEDTRKRGAQGPPGPPGEGLSTFFSKRLSLWLNDILDFSCYFKDEKSGFIYDKGGVAVGIKNQVGKINAKTKYKVESLIEIPTYGYGLQFSKSIYVIEKMDWASILPSKAVLIFAFKIDKWPSKYGYLFSTQNDERAVYLKGVNMIIKGSSNTSVSVKYELREWNTVYIEFNNSITGDSFYEINGEKGTFTTEGERFSDKVIYIGGKGDLFFQGVIARIDFLSRTTGERLENIASSIKDSFLLENYDIEDELVIRDGGCVRGGRQGSGYLAEQSGYTGNEFKNEFEGADTSDCGSDEV